MTALVHTVRGVPKRRKNVCWDCRCGKKVFLMGAFGSPSGVLIECICEESTHYEHMLFANHPACQHFKPHEEEP